VWKREWKQVILLTAYVKTKPTEKILFRRFFLLEYFVFLKPTYLLCSFEHKFDETHAGRLITIKKSNGQEKLDRYILKKLD